MDPTESGGGNRDGLLPMINRVRNNWRDRSLTSLLVIQIITLFILVPLAGDGFPMPGGAAVLLLLVVMSLTIVMARGRWTLVAGLTTFLLSGIATILAVRMPSVAMEVLRSSIALVTFSILAIVVSKAVFGPGPFTNHRILGAIVLYLNIGLLFSFLYRIIALILPDAYSHLPSPFDEAKFAASLDYFSFTTMTSVGYGDILPLRPVSRSLCALESIMGQLFPTVLIARVVSLATMGKNSD